MENSQQKPINYFGIISFVFALLSLFTPKIFLILPLSIGIIFGIIGSFKTSRALSLISLVLLGITVFSVIGELTADQIASDKTYKVEYVVVGDDFKVTYQNSSGGTDHEEVMGSWEETVYLKGNDFAYISAQNSRKSGNINVKIYIDDKLCKTSTSSGAYAIASESCFPKSCCN